MSKNNDSDDVAVRRTPTIKTIDVNSQLYQHKSDVLLMPILE